MKQSTLIFLILTLGAAIAGAEIVPTMELDRSLLSIEASTGAVNYADFDQIAISESLTLPFKTVYLELGQGE